MSKVDEEIRKIHTKYNIYLTTEHLGDWTHYYADIEATRDGYNVIVEIPMVDKLTHMLMFEYIPQPLQVDQDLVVTVPNHDENNILAVNDDLSGYRLMDKSKLSTECQKIRDFY